jgi:phospholipase C
MRLRIVITTLVALALGVGLLGTAAAAPQNQQHQKQTGPRTTTPIKYVVVIFQENVSFDHYFGTYPSAQNPPGEPSFLAKPNTPSVNGLNDFLLNHNPNLNNPTRLDRSQALTCDQNHDYLPEQLAFDHGLMDKFVQNTSGGSCTDKSIVMDYYDGNTVTALWNYAQYFSMSDNSFGTTFGPSTPGALNLVSGQTNGATPNSLPGYVANGSVIGDPDPVYDGCSGSTTVSMSGTNSGDLLNAKGVTWGWFQGGFTPTSRSKGTIVCGSSHQNIGGQTVSDYSAHHEPFQYYQSTSNPQHLPPTSVSMIGQTDQANHQYDLSNFWQAVNAGNQPSVSFLKAAKYQDGHAGYSDPQDEQNFLVNTINSLEKLPTWNQTAVVINYDDSDGWYDHVMGPIVNQSNDPINDGLTDPGMCGTPQQGAYLDRCGYGPRLPLIVISPFARENFVDNSVTDQSSILRFIEDNWQLGSIGNQSTDAIAGTLNNLFNFSHPDFHNKLFLDPITGEPTKG